VLPTQDRGHGEDDELWIGWKWFELHSKQRLESFKFFALTYGAATSLAVSLMRPTTIFIALILCVLTTLTCIIFWQLDVRNRQLIEIGESIIRKRWDQLGLNPDVNPILAAALKLETGIRYKHAFLFAFLCCTSLSIVLFATTIFFIHHPAVLAQLVITSK
jgi:hypothetical protein